MKANFAHRRSGVAAIWTMLVIAIVSVMMVATIARFTSARQRVEAYRNSAQSDWLARSGYEIAVAKVLADPEGYKGETISPITNGEVKITVRRDPENKEVYRVTSESSYPSGTKRAVKRILQRSFKRIVGLNGDRIEHFLVPLE
jgi:type II secretory pathway pseudopilin PulG